MANIFARTPVDPSSVAITGGNIDGAVIGGTTPAAGDFTTLGATGQLTLSIDDDAVTPTLTFGTGDGIYSQGANVLDLALNGVRAFFWTTTQFGTDTTTGPSLQDEVASATNPTSIPDRGDLDTGIGQAADDQLSLIAGAVEGVRVTETAGATAVTINANANNIMEGYTTGRNILRTILVRLQPGATAGTNINVSELGSIRGFNRPTITDGTDIAKSGSSGSFSLSADGLTVTMDITEAIVGIISASFKRHNINTSSTTEMYTPDVTFSGDNLTIALEKRGGNVAIDLTTLMDTGDVADIYISFITSS